MDLASRRWSSFVKGHSVSTPSPIPYSIRTPSSPSPSHVPLYVPPHWRLGSSRGWGNTWGSDTPTCTSQGAGQDSVTRDIYFKPLIRLRIDWVMIKTTVKWSKLVFCTYLSHFSTVLDDFFLGQPDRSSTLSSRVRVQVSFSTPRGWPVPLPTDAFLHLLSILLFLPSLHPCPSPWRSSREGLVHIFILFLTHYCLPPPIRLSDDSSMMTHLLLIPSSHHLLFIISNISVFSIY